MGDPQVQTTPRFSLPALLGWMGLGSTAGSIAGFMWGGVGGRIAMRILTLTSDDRLRGAISDDGFEIGRISAGTVFLLVLSTILGGIAGAIYGAVRAVVSAPNRVLAPAVGIAAAAIGGSFIVHADGIDFRVLEPLWLTVGLFVLIPGLWGLTIVPLSDRLRERVLKFPHTDLEPAGGRPSQLVGWAFLAFVAVMGTLGLIRDVRALI